MEHFAVNLLPIASTAAVAGFAGLTLLAVLEGRRVGRAARWVAAAFSAVTLALLVSWAPIVTGIDLDGRLEDIWVVPILMFPYLLLRFSASFGQVARRVELLAAVASATVAVATVAIFAVPGGLDSRSWWTSAYTLLALAYWVGTSLVTVRGLWRAGSGQPTVTRRRMRLMSTATTALAVALLATSSTAIGTPSSVRTLLPTFVQLVVAVSAAMFALGLRPPHGVALSWRQAEEAELRSSMMAVLQASEAEDVIDALLPPTTRIVGGSGAAIVDGAGFVAASYGDAPAVGVRLSSDGESCLDGRDREVVPLGAGRGELQVWTSRYTPFFGQQEVNLLHTLGMVAVLALDRCDLLEDEREQRATVERAREEAELAREEAERAREEATRANTAKSEFLSRMSHELRTPLNAILGFGQILEVSDLNDDDRDGARHITKAGRHLLALINDILDLSRIEAGMMAVSLEPVHTAELLHEAISLIQPLADSRSIQLIATDEDELYVMTDRQRCRQVLLNLLSNAVKYNHDGGEVEVSCTRMTDAVVRVSVRDTGPGIAPERSAKLFEPFERLGAESTGVEGTGLGLALTKQLVERLGGSIGVLSAPGDGATFWVDMPLTEHVTTVATPSPTSVDSAAADGKTLLLVEDNLANLRVVESMLRRRPGISVLPVMQGRMAIDLAHQHQPDVIVLDLHLPDVHGREVLIRLKADVRTRHIPVVIASADSTPGRMRQLRQEGAFAYVTKPLDLGEFLDVVDTAIAHRDPQLGEVSTTEAAVL